MIESVFPIKPLDGLSQYETSNYIGNETLENIIQKLEEDLENGDWIKKNYAKNDVKIMPALIIQANNKYSEIHLNFVPSPWDLSVEIKKTIEQGVESAKFIINLGDNGIHFSVIDYKNISGKISLILFESASFNSLGPALLGFRTQCAIDKMELADCHFSMVEMDIQRSSSECGIFSLSLAKKLYTEKEHLLKLHEDNVKDALCDNEDFLPHDKLDPYLPVTFFKHTQGKKRLDEYLDINPHGANSIINKNNETIISRFNKNLVVIEDKAVSVSMHRKRIVEYKKVLIP